MSAITRAKLAILGALLLMPAAASANHDVFLGWAKDGTFYVRLEDSNDTNPIIDFCRLAENPTWPPKLSGREHENGCVYLNVDKNRDAQIGQVRRLVEEPRASSNIGPHGMKLKVDWVNLDASFKEAVARITDGQRKLNFRTGRKLSKHGDQLPRTRITEYFWRPDGKSVAFYIDTDPKDPDGERWLTVLDLTKAGQP